MKRLIKFFISALLVITFGLVGCNEVLDITPKSELADDFLATEKGLQTVLYGAYGQQNQAQTVHQYIKVYPLLAADLGYGRGGAFEPTSGIPMETFQFQNAGWIPSFWNSYFTGIRNTNVVISRLQENDYREAFRNEKMGEAKALRGYFYYQLYMLFGPVPLFTKEVEEDLEKARATDEEIRALIEQDLAEAASLLPVQQDMYGKITRGAALSLLTKFYLNTKQWQKAIDTGEQVRSLGVYGLVPNYVDIYSLDNEGHEEAIWPILHNDERFSDIIALITPPDYPLPPGVSAFAARVYGRDWFVGSFAENDVRGLPPMIIREYTTRTGTHFQGFGTDRSLFFKYPPPPPGNAQRTTIDMISVRYADILLSIAEARNEVQGPNQQSIDLINMIRDRAGVDRIQLNQFASTAALREHILNERLWEFYFEGLEREDMIRHGVFISRAQARGVNAQEFHRLYPIPQAEITANRKMVQNPGY